MLGLFSFIALWKCKQLLGLNYNISFQLQYYLQVLPIHSLFTCNFFFMWVTDTMISTSQFTCVNGLNVHRKQGFQLQRAIWKKLRSQSAWYECPMYVCVNKKYTKYVNTHTYIYIHIYTNNPCTPRGVMVIWCVIYYTTLLHWSMNSSCLTQTPTISNLEVFMLVL